MAKNNKKNGEDEASRIRLSSIAVYYIFQQCFNKAGVIVDNEFQDKGWAARLIRQINTTTTDRQITGAPSFPQYLSDRFREACTDINQNNPHKSKGYSPVTLEPLLTYSKILDFEDINISFRTSAQKYFIDDIKNSKLQPAAIAQFLRGALPDNADVVTIPDVEHPSSMTTPDLNTETRPVKIAAVYASKPYSRFDIFTRITDDEGELCFYENGDCEWRGETTFIVKQANLREAEEFRMPNDTRVCWVRVAFIKDEQTCYVYFAEQQPAETPLRLLSPQKILDYCALQLAKAGQVI